jgi:hypothetical protein
MKTVTKGGEADDHSLYDPVVTWGTLGEWGSLQSWKIKHTVMTEVACDTAHKNYA